ncbi:excalibur calcium-binding domain-containing protein [Nocardioides massiliensis]|uniref:Excalibur calcium-binding domain-containing protein n=1 Tax=Nocardioides massiliensis TaxID=1325935 RepID=A0ABT9NR73_9ACTN|nr:excalibur calcium-binding domain-containing protein [Nocardioides massiliensis]MDP9822767.1 hypothetical protein [Nocardioides massiliensis]
MTLRTRAPRMATALAGIGLVVSSLTLASPAAANQYYSSCANLTKDFRHGVAKNKKAANYQVAQGNRRPAYGKKARKAYSINASRLDRDKDGTACEQS